MSEATNATYVVPEADTPPSVRDYTQCLEVDGQMFYRYRGPHLCRLSVCVCVCVCCAYQACVCVLCPSSVCVPLECVCVIAGEHA